jgi:hypothetical protein
VSLVVYQLGLRVIQAGYSINSATTEGNNICQDSTPLLHITQFERLCELVLAELQEFGGLDVELKRDILLLSGGKKHKDAQYKL